MYALEDSYWWFVGRHELSADLLAAAEPGRIDLRILDLGCGTGAMSARLRRFGTVVSADFSPLALDFCRRRGLTRLCAADAMRLPFASGSFDAVVALDVMEHLPDDAACAAEIRRVLRPGGHLVATVPAYQFLWSAHDIALMHYRRYTVAGLRRLVIGAGLSPRRLSYAMTLLFPIVWAVRRATRESGEPKASLVPVPAPVNALLVAALRAENALLRAVRLPFGVTVCCLARRPEEPCP